jgi:hypothetical protein
MKLVIIGNKEYLAAEVTEKELTAAFEMKGDFGQSFCRYLIAEEIGKLITFQLSNTPVQIRELTIEEELIVRNLRGTMAIAKERAMSNLVANTFSDMVSGKN